MMDDILDYTSCEEEFGKPVGKDLREGKITLPLIYTLSNLENDEVERLQDLFKSQKAKDRDYSGMIDMVGIVSFRAIDFNVIQPSVH